MNGTYRVARIPENTVEEEVNAAYTAGWEVVTAFVARFIYGIGGEYQAKEVQVIFRRRELNTPGTPA
jgi:hypothetical protein